MSGAIYVLNAAIVLVIASAASLLSSCQKLQTLKLKLVGRDVQSVHNFITKLTPNLCGIHTSTPLMWWPNKNRRNPVVP